MRFCGAGPTEVASKLELGHGLYRSGIAVLLSDNTTQVGTGSRRTRLAVLRFVLSSHLGVL